MSLSESESKAYDEGTDGAEGTTASDGHSLPRTDSGSSEALSPRPPVPTAWSAEDVDRLRMKFDRIATHLGPVPELRPMSQGSTATLSLRLALRTGTANKNPKGPGPRAGKDHIFKNGRLTHYMRVLVHGTDGRPPAFPQLRQPDLETFASSDVCFDCTGAAVCPQVCVGSTTILLFTKHRYRPHQQISYNFTDAMPARPTHGRGPQTFLMAVDDEVDASGENPFVASLMDEVRRCCNAEVWYQEVGAAELR